MESEREAEIETERRTQVKFSARSKMNKMKTDAMRRDAKKLELRFFLSFERRGECSRKVSLRKTVNVFSLSFFVSVVILTCKGER